MTVTKPLSAPTTVTPPKASTPSQSTAGKIPLVAKEKLGLLSMVLGSSSELALFGLLLAHAVTPLAMLGPLVAVIVGLGFLTAPDRVRFACLQMVNEFIADCSELTVEDIEKGHKALRKELERLLGQDLFLNQILSQLSERVENIQNQISTVYRETREELQILANKFRKNPTLRKQFPQVVATGEQLATDIENPQNQTVAQLNTYKTEIQKLPAQMIVNSALQSYYALPNQVPATIVIEPKKALSPQETFREKFAAWLTRLENNPQEIAKADSFIREAKALFQGEEFEQYAGEIQCLKEQVAHPKTPIFQIKNNKLEAGFYERNEETVTAEQRAEIERQAAARRQMIASI